MKHSRRTCLNQLLGLAAIGLAGCQSQKLAPAQLSSLFFNRAAFGPRPGDLENFSLEQFLAEQLNPEQIDDKQCEARLAAAKLKTLNKPFAAMWRDHYLLMDQANDLDSDEAWAMVELPYSEAVQSTLIRAVYSRCQLREVLVDFWHNHFNVYGLHDDVSPLMMAYDRDVIRPHVFGNFRRFLQAVASHPAMLLYLNNSSNAASGPNENFARELLELHTLGAMNYGGCQNPRTVATDPTGLAQYYVDNDVYEVSRCFTGWSLDESDSDNTTSGTGQFLLRSEDHDRFNKLVLGRYFRNDQGALADGEAVLDLLAQHPGTARHISFKLCRRLVSDNPPEGLVARAARVFMQHHKDERQLAKLVETVLRSPEFALSHGQKFKRPLEFATSLIRALDIDFRPDEQFVGNFNAMGQPLFGRLTPDGYPDIAQSWQHSSSLWSRWRLADRIIRTSVTQTGRTLSSWSRQILGREAHQTELLTQAKSVRESLGLLVMGPEFQIR